MEQLRCHACGETRPTPRHCGQAMQVADVDGKQMLVCWMGAGCGVKDVPVHCGTPMVAAE